MIHKPPTLLSREEARSAKKPFYYTGDTCKHGHRSARYTSTGNCVECLKNGRATRNNPHTRGLISYAPRMLWVNKRMTEAHWGALDVYLQQCADQFTQAIETQLRPWCEHCGGFGKVAGGRDCLPCHTSGVQP